MKHVKTKGFTIIETMLFLAVTALLIVGVLTNVGSSINVQRYRDSVTALQSVLQQQFSEVSNVNNSNDGSLACNGATEARGQSDCVLLGRYITTSDGKTLAIKNIMGHINPGVTLLSDDITALQQYNIEISPLQGEDYEVEWGGTLKETAANGGSTSNFSILILRSPSSGVNRTFIDPDNSIADNRISTMLNTTMLSRSVDMCVDSNGLFNGGKSSVTINAYATNASSVETKGEALSGC
jgi:type II secretory pathway pseudopilin PulG